MKKLYLVVAVIVFLLILILALPQFGGTCTFYGPLRGTQSCPVALFQTAGLGGIMGGLLVLFWKESKKGEGGDDDEDDNGNSSDS